MPQFTWVTENGKTRVYVDGVELKMTCVNVVSVTLPMPPAPVKPDKPARPYYRQKERY